MTSNPEFDVIINGGGPVGMGLAIELGQRGIRTCVIERSLEPAPIPKGQNLTQRTCEHFRAWGCEDEIRTAHPIPEGGGIGGMTCYGQLLSDYHYDWLNRAHVKDYYFAANARLPQYATEAVLRARAARIAEITTCFGWSGTSISQDEDGVCLTARNGEETRKFTARYAVGCDGSRSMIRPAAGISETLSDHDRLMALLVFRSTELDSLLKRYPGKSFYNVLHPDYQGYWQFFGRVDHGLSWFFHAPVPLGTTRENFDFRAMLHKAVGQPFALEFDYIGFWELRVSMADSYRTGRIFIAGDAAHSHPPYGGFGINTGFEDARNLGWKLAAVLQGWGGAALLDSYDAERRPVFASTARDFIERFIEEDRAFLNRYSPDKDRQAFETAWHSRNLDADEVNAFEPHYEGSPIVRGTGHPSARGSHSFQARTGHLLPPPGPGATVALAAGIGNGLSLLTEDPDAALARAFRQAAAEARIPFRVVGLPDGAAGIYKARFTLIRPDRFVAWTGETCDPSTELNRATGAWTARI
ncbi:MAG: FAD-dependent monooxygenase [Rhodobacter sp.]|nr:FAD-dependent monooxygenase [Rhodobacter sp.]